MASLATPKTGRIDYTTQDPKKIAQQNRQLIGAQGDTLNEQALQQATTANAASGRTQDFLGGVENPLAQGQGGYNAAETSQIQMTPEQQQQLVTGAGISAGTGTAASVGAAERATDATGGNPLALAAYRARAAQQQGSQAGDAMTQARIGASNAAASRAENIGQTRIGQQNQALNYYGGLQAQQAGEAQNAYSRQQQTYGTQTGGINGSASASEQASQNPSMFDKVMGGVSGAISGGALKFLDDGDITNGTTPAVVGENGPEKVVDLGGQQPQADFMDEGGVVPSLATLPHSADYNTMVSGGRPLGTTTPNADGSLTFAAPPTAGGSAPDASTSWIQRAKNFLQSHQQQPQPGAPAAAQPQTAGVPPAATSIGKTVGNIASLFHLEDGGVATSAGKTPPQASPYAKPGPYLTTLPPQDEQQFQQWVKSSHAPFDSSPTADYDMRGYWQQNKGGTQGTQMRKDGLHFPDTFKTPYHKTFSNESKYATPDAPHWSGDKLYDKSGKMLTDETSLAPAPAAHMADGGIAPQGANGIFTKPTRVNLSPNEAVVPLSYRAGAKVRPSMAALPAARTRQQYGSRI